MWSVIGISSEDYLLLYHLGHSIELILQSWEIQMRENELESDNILEHEPHCVAVKVTVLLHEMK